jgi:hypothetical protein
MSEWLLRGTGAATRNRGIVLEEQTPPARPLTSCVEILVRFRAIREPAGNPRAEAKSAPRSVAGLHFASGAAGSITTRGMALKLRDGAIGENRRDPEARLMPGTVTVPLRSRTNASPFWIMLLLVLGRLDNGMIRIWQPDTGAAKMPSTDPIPSVTADLLTRALGEAVIRIWSNCPPRSKPAGIDPGRPVPK